MSIRDVLASAVLILAREPWYFMVRIKASASLFTSPLEAMVGSFLSDCREIDAPTARLVRHGLG